MKKAVNNSWLILLIVAVVILLVAIWFIFFNQSSGSFAMAGGQCGNPGFGTCAAGSTCVPGDRGWGCYSLGTSSGSSRTNPNSPGYQAGWNWAVNNLSDSAVRTAQETSNAAIERFSTAASTSSLNQMTPCLASSQHPLRLWRALLASRTSPSYKCLQKESRTSPSTKYLDGYFRSPEECKVEVCGLSEQLPSVVYGCFARCRTTNDCTQYNNPSSRYVFQCNTSSWQCMGSSPTDSNLCDNPDYR